MTADIHVDCGWRQPISFHHRRTCLDQRSALLFCHGFQIAPIRVGRFTRDSHSSAFKSQTCTPAAISKTLKIPQHSIKRFFALRDAINWKLTHNCKVLNFAIEEWAGRVFFLTTGRRGSNQPIPLHRMNYAYIYPLPFRQ